MPYFYYVTAVMKMYLSSIYQVWILNVLTQLWWHLSIYFGINGFHISHYNSCFIFLSHNGSRPYSKSWSATTRIEIMPVLGGPRTSMSLDI